MRAVLDTNVIVSGVIKEEGAPGQILQLLLKAKAFTAVTSPAILAEVREVLRRGKIRKYHGWTDAEVDAFVVFLYSQCVLTEGALTVDVVSRDPDDNKFIACAEEGNVDYLVSGDDDLLQIKTYKNIAIIPPAEFLKHLKSS